VTLKCFISPYANDGILRVIEAQMEHLPKFGVELASLPSQADVICNHGTMLIEQPGIPSVNVNHGLYWSRQPWGDDFMDINRDIVTAMQHSDALTVPSEWVGRAVRRGGYFYPEVVYHGIDHEKFQPGHVTENYVLWNKARADYVSDPQDLRTIATYMPQTRFISTMGFGENVKTVGALPHSEMKKLVSEAGIYLATARETFGIGTLEALAYGVPVAGWDWGGTGEIILPGVTGYLAPPGDYSALAECIERCFADRKRLSQNAIEDIRARWRWEPRIEQYANLFKCVAEGAKRTPKVSVIVTAYKLDEFLPQCLNSVVEQTFGDFECIVVDDGLQESTRKLVGEYAKRDKRFSYLAPTQNLGLPGARNFGLQHSHGKYIRHVDADDFLAENALALESTALDTNRGVHIVYGHIEVVRTDGSRVLEHGEPVRGGWPKESFNWYEQMAHLNQLPSCVMARREVYERSGGYRERMTRNEDAEFWCRVTSLGFKALKFTGAVTYFHRERHDSKGANEWATEGKERDWTAWFPWRMGADGYEQAQKVIRTRGYNPPLPHLVPFGAQGPAPRDLRFWYIHDYQYPVVSIIVTCGPGHRKYLIDALDSIQAQTFPDWECVVVNDTGEKWPRDIMGAPWAKVVNMDGNRGAAEARNEGLKHTRGKFIVWMDADDFWLPWFLERMVSVGEVNPGVIYSDIILKGEKENRINRYSDFDSTRVVQTMQYPGSSILVPRKIAETMVEMQGGFDENIPGMEDWDYQIAVHHLGFCAYRIPEPLFVYRLLSSTKREKDYAKIDDIVRYIDAKWSMYRTGEKQIMCGCNTPRTPTTPLPQSLLSSSGNFSVESIQQAINTNDPTMQVMVEYVGPQVDTFSIRSRAQRDIIYRFGNNDLHRTRTVFVTDAAYLIGLGDKDGNPIYRIVSNVVGVPEANDPSAFLGEPLVA